MKLNKYLREIGVDESRESFDEKIKEYDSRYLPDDEGFVHADFFSLDSTFSLYIYSHLCYFKEHCAKFAVPGSLAEGNFEEGLKKWNSILDKMILAFKLTIVNDDSTERSHGDYKVRKQLSNRRNKQIKYGMRLFTEYYFSLWY